MEAAEWETLRERVKQAISLIQRLTAESKNLKEENHRLTKSLALVEREATRGPTKSVADDARVVQIRERLSRVIARLERLER